MATTDTQNFFATPPQEPRRFKSKLLLTVLLGIATGMPPVLVTVTLGFWLRSEGTTLSAIGFLSWVGLFFSLKLLWAPFIDAVPLPWIGRLLGHRRSWMLLGQTLVIVGILGMAFVGPSGGLGWFAIFAMLTAFASATQDIAVDAWRIESAKTSEQEQMASAYVFGVRLGYFLGNVPIFAMSAYVGWPIAYASAAIGGVAGLIALLLAAEAKNVGPRHTIGALRDVPFALLLPLRVFWQDHGRGGLLLLTLMALYFVPDGLISAMVAPLYADLGFSARQIAVTRTLFGFPAMLFGVLAAAVLGRSKGNVAALAVGVSLAALSNIGFAWLAWSDGERMIWIFASMFEGFSAGLAAAAMVATASRLTSLQVTASQFAMLSSLMTLLPNLLSGVSGAAVQALQTSSGSSMQGYGLWFSVTSLAALPVLLLLYLTRHKSLLPASPTAARNVYH